MDPQVAVLVLALLSVGIGGIAVVSLRPRSAPVEPGTTQPEAPPAPFVDEVMSPVRIVTHPGQAFHLGVATGTSLPFYGIWAARTNQLARCFPYTPDGWASAWKTYQLFERETSEVVEGRRLARTRGSVAEPSRPDAPRRTWLGPRTVGWLRTARGPEGSSFRP